MHVLWAGQQALSVQQLEAQRQQVRASILSQMGAPQAAQQPAYANDPRYPVSSLPPINNSAAGTKLSCFGKLRDLAWSHLASWLQPMDLLKASGSCSVWFSQANLRHLAAQACACLRQRTKRRQSLQAYSCRIYWLELP